MRIELNSGRDIDVRKPGWFAFRQRGFLNTVRADGCNYFTTVLGPATMPTTPITSTSTSCRAAA